MLDQNWKVQVHPEAKKENILQGDKYRITLLTEEISCRGTSTGSPCLQKV